MVSLTKINARRMHHCSQNHYYQCSVILLFALLTGCASTPDFDTAQVDLSLTPQRVVAESEQSYGKTILWGGTILDSKNLEGATRFEVLSYPLDSSNRPQIENPPLGRFILFSRGYLEATTYAQGRIITVLGLIDKNVSGKVGESDYTYPVVNSQQLHLWSLDSGRNQGNFQFGLGIGIGL